MRRVLITGGYGAVGREAATGAVPRCAERDNVRVARACLPPSGVRHIDGVIEPGPFLGDLAKEGSGLDLGTPRYDAR